MKQPTVVAAGLAVVVLLGFGASRFLLRTASAPVPPPIRNTATLLQQIQTLSQLVTVRYVMEKVVVLEDARWYGENRVMLVAHGAVKAGVDFSQLRAEDLQVTSNKVVLRLPPAIVTDVYLDDHRTQVLERNTGMLRHFDKDLEQNARRQAIAEMLRAARTNGIEKDATERAQAQLNNLFHQLGFSQVELRTQP